MASSSTYSNPPCAACKFLRRKCLPGSCTFAPYFPPQEPIKFANVHKIFGASNVSKLLNEIPPHQREDAVNSLAYEAEARLKDPVYGCAGAISVLQKQVIQLQKELDAANADLMRYVSIDELPNKINNAYNPMFLMSSLHDDDPHLGNGQFYGRRVDYGGSSFCPNTRFMPRVFSSPWSVNGQNPGKGEDGLS